MSVFVSLEIDDFQKTFSDKLAQAKSSRRSGQSPSVRRPTRGLEVKDDTYAIMRVVRPDGSCIPLFDSGALDGTGQNENFANFLLQGVNEARMEKQQIVETFGEPYIFFFGEAPRFIDVQAVLLKSFDFNWRAEWWENYDKYLRGTKLVEMGARCYLFYEDTIVEGYILNAQTMESSDMPMYLQLQFRMFVTNYANISFIGDPFYPIRAGAVPPPGVADFTDMDAWGQLTPKYPDQTSPEQDAQEAFLQALRASGQSQIETQIQRQKALNSVLKAEQQIAANEALMSAGSFFSSSYLTAVLQRGMTSTAFPAQDIEGFLFNVQQFLENAGTSLLGPQPPQHVRAMRSKIADNRDEYVNGGITDIEPGTGVHPGTTAKGQNDPTITPGGPVNSPPVEPLDTLNQQSCLNGAQMGPDNFYGFGLVPYAPGVGVQGYGAFGRPLGAGAGFTGGAVAGGAFAGAAGGAFAGAGVGGTVGIPFQAGAGAQAVAGAYAGQVPFGSQMGLGGAPGSVAGLILSNQGLSSQGGFTGTGFGFRGAFSRSYGFTAGVGGSFGGSMGGAFGPGVGGGLGGYGAVSFGNPAYVQAGNVLNQQAAFNPFGLPTGSPYGLGYSAPGQPNTSSVYRYTAGIRPDGTLYGSGGYVPMGVPAGSTNFGGFGAVAGAQSSIFGGAANMSAVASLGASVQGDGVFGMQAVPGTYGVPCT